MPHHNHKYYNDVSRIEKIKYNIWLYCIIERTYEQISKHINMCLRQTKHYVLEMSKDGTIELKQEPGKKTIIIRKNYYNG